MIQKPNLLVSAVNMIDKLPLTGSSTMSSGRLGA